jgi:chemosensory pili system protein ChpA (sensor histidine kinase/response regulator)
MDEYLLPGGALLLLLVLLWVVRGRQRRRAQLDQPAESTGVAPSRFRSWRAASRHDSIQSPGPASPAEDADAQRAEREAAEVAARLEGDREAAEWEARLVAEQLAHRAEEQARLAADSEIHTLTPLQIAAQAQAAAERSEREALDSLQQSYAEAEAEAERRTADRRSEDRRSAVRRADEVESVAPIPAPELEPVSVSAPMPAPALASPPPPAGVVVIADASKVVRIKTSRLLEQHGWRVLLATDGLEALEHIGLHGPQALITGAELPGLDGLALTRRLRADERTAQLPIVMISADDDSLSEVAHAAGVSLLLGKPYPEHELIAFMASTRESAAEA